MATHSEPPFVIPRETPNLWRSPPFVIARLPLSFLRSSESLALCSESLAMALYLEQTLHVVQCDLESAWDSLFTLSSVT